MHENYEETCSTLTELMEIIRHAKFGVDGKWKPFQRGFIVSTTSLLELAEFLLKEKGFHFLLPGRILQDCLENLFSTVRSGNPKRNAVQVRDSIKQISVSEYISPPLRHSSYQWSDNTFLDDFLKIVQAVKSENKNENSIVKENDKENLDINLWDVDISKVIISRREQNVLYKVACYIMFKITTSKKKLHCLHCLSYCRLLNEEPSSAYSKLARQPNLQYNTNENKVYINDEIFLYFIRMEKFFRLAYPILVTKNKFNLERLITSKILDQGFKPGIPNCHSLLKTLTKRYVAFRLKNAGSSREKKKTFNFSSRTMN
ncbi:hypothetical protein HA402_003408 [Bradysia odoriphaga]|nr:hypothetical protein HA402_003408 [Bradysia odoriphaga]